ncbi:MFS transporter [Enterococcus sp. JM4C]|uniref:MFS transporter n=1 Tax=Candidatus Enterococcus huntleyi TaxID=1857217 RepID=UPI00137B66D5|nr:MFS transporter [Enterococcus sp. JM4C]KAF1297400.1 MFS transporter [Enterococcus sp. JM4C]
MYSLLLAIIYIAFISLGLPDSLVGSAWPIMHTELNVPVSYAGIITMTIAAGTIVSSIFSDKLTRKLGTGMVTTLSVLTTAIALFGFSISHSFFALILWAIPYGLGAGAVDAALNNYVALNYASRHMNWLHCFWGVGAALSPYIMSYYLTNGQGWNTGYRTIGLLQIALTFVLFISLPLWKQNKRPDRLSTTEKNETTEKIEPAEITESKALSFKEILRLRGIKAILLAFFSYSAIEQTAGLWASSFLVQIKDITPEIAASFGSFFFLGITFGRFICGFVADYLGDKQLIRIGTGILFIGVILLAFPTTISQVALAGLLIIGVGCAPIYPAIIHATPTNFGKEHSQAVIGIQMAFAYVGTTFMPPLFGFIAAKLTIGLYPLYLIIFVGIMFVATESLNKIVKERTHS